MNGKPAPIERKVTWATLGAYLGTTAGLAVLEAVTAQPVLVTPLPDILEPFVLALVPAGVSFLAGVRAKHTPRPDLPIGTEPGKR